MIERRVFPPNVQSLFDFELEDGASLKKFRQSNPWSTGLGSSQNQNQSFNQTCYWSKLVIVIITLFLSLKVLFLFQLLYSLAFFGIYILCSVHKLQHINEGRVFCRNMSVNFKTVVIYLKLIAIFMQSRHFDKIIHCLVNKKTIWSWTKHRLN